MDFINAAQLPVCQMRPNCFGCTKEQMNSLSVACKEPGAWLSLSSRRNQSFSLVFTLSAPTSLYLPPSFSPHYWPSRISYHTSPHSHNDCSYRYIHHATGHLPPLIDMVPASAGNAQLAKRWFPPSVGKLQVQHFLKHYLYLTKGNRKQ